MLAVLRRNPVALALAILLHIGLAVFLILEVDWREQVKPIGADVMVVQATLVDQQKIDAAEKKKKDEARAKAAAAKRAEQEKLKKRRAEEKRKLAEIEKKRKQEAARKKAEEQKRVEAEKVRLAEKQRKEEEKKKAEEKRRKEELEKKRALEEKQRKEEEAARKKKAEAEAKAKKEAEARRRAEEKKKAEAERKRKAEAARKAKAEADRKAREAELAAQIAAEQDASELQRTIALIQEKIERNWLRPPGTEGLKCELEVRLGASGSVLLVRVVKSSGNIAFDRSVEAAVRKADPLPMPRSKRLLAKFRGDVRLIFDPSS